MKIKNLDNWDVIEDDEEAKELVEDLLSKQRQSIENLMDKLEEDEPQKNSTVLATLSKKIDAYQDLTNFRIETECKPDDVVVLYNERNDLVTMEKEEEYEKMQSSDEDENIMYIR